jgi:hypothetical protein
VDVLINFIGLHVKQEKDTKKESLGKVGGNLMPSSHRPGRGRGEHTSMLV